MRPTEVKDAGVMTGRVMAEIAEIAEGVHFATSRRVFGRLGPAAAPVRVAHDLIAAVSHRSVRLGLRAIPAVAGYAGGSAVAARALTTGVAPTSVHDSPEGRFVLSAVAGILGDSVETDHPSLAPPLTIRTHDGPRRQGAGPLQRDLVGASGKVVVFAHGLCESDMSWQLGGGQHWADPSSTMGSRLRSNAGWTPLYLHYNSGRHVSDNGGDVAALLASVVRSWPVPVTSLALVGHSMGGLVLRSAVAQSAGAAWTEHLTDMVFLGTPHLGAPMERGVHDLGTALARFPETTPYATFLRRRSVGVKDLRHGAVVAADWAEVDLDDDRTDRCTVVDFPEGVRVHAVGATLARDHDSRAGRMFGDVLVQFDSAGSRRHATRRLPSDEVHHVGGINHFDLLNHPAVDAAVRDWLR